ncbi:MAG: hypothetical protein PHE17_19560 [Thiothrix sp.]|uniref:hypothetical protein n=1 Tax=Thiothrix sp. TaxID=1032 RepID=UPI00260A8DC7|nr:hypothetical protein [Thiothrix sp.]MDD5395226.1 hypothetical protein [Thiothrix sp.]
MKFTATFLFALFGLAVLASTGSAHAGECKADGNSIKTALAAKHRVPTSKIVIVEISNTTPSKPGYVETDVSYEAPNSMATYKSRVTVKGQCNQ